MITLTELVDLCGLTQEEVDAIAEHEHMPEASAAAMASYLMHLPNGAAQVRLMIRDDLREALRHGNKPHARELLATLHRFCVDHPDALGHR